MIPKIIHTVWIGDNGLSDIEVKWIKNNQDRTPDYKGVHWHEENVPSCKFLEVALKEGKLAYASDYVRMHALYHEGGIYMDIDFELIDSIPEEWLEKEIILPKETDYELGGYFIGCRKGSKFAKRMLDEYLNFDGDTIDIEEWIIPNLIKRNLFKTVGEYSVILPIDGSFRSSKIVELVEPKYLNPYYPWDITRCNHMVDLEFAIGIHYWNNYKSDKGITLDSFGTETNTNG